MGYDQDKEIADSVIVSMFEHIRDQGSDDENLSVGTRIEETIDAWLDLALHPTLDAILAIYGEVDLSEPMPDLAEGWFRVRKQLACNAARVEIVRRLKNAGVRGVANE